MSSEERMQADGAVLPLRYQLLRELGRGGMGVVYLAQDSEFGQVAVKLLPPHGTQSEETRRFQREAVDLAGLSHPNVVRLLEAGEGQDRDYIVMEYVGGGSLKDLRGQVTLRETLEIFEQVCQGLAYIHERGLVHRDLKPDNILLTPERQPKITDFGIARRVEQRTKLTQVGSILGTCDYLPPEQIASSQVSPAADLYSLGVCLFEAVTGRLPFVEDMEFRVLQAHVKTPPPVPSTLRPGLPPALDDLIGQLLQKRPEQRPENATKVATRLAEIGFQLPTLGDATPGLELAGRAPVLDNLLGVVTQAVRGVGMAALLIGERGSGRSVLLDHLLKRLRAEPGARILRLAPAPIGQALPSLWSRLGRDPAELEKLLDAEGREGVAQGVARVLAAQEPVVLIVDDYERLDSLSRYAVAELVKSPPPPRTCWLVSLRSEERDDFPESTPTVTLEGLERKTLLELATAWLDARPGPRLEQVLVERTAGSPRRLRILCGCLEALGLEAADGTVELRDEPPALDDLVRAVLSQRGGLLEVARLTMWARDAVSRDLLLAASELPAEQVKTVITELERRGILEWQPGYPEDEEEPRLRFAMPSLAARIRGEGQGTAVHVQLARALPPGPERARHLGLGKQPLARQTLADQATRLGAAGCVEEELELWVLASEISKGAEQSEARVQAARCRSQLGLSSQAVAELTALLENPAAETLRPLVVLTLARALATSGDRAAALDLLDKEPEPEEPTLLVQDLELRSELNDNLTEKLDLLQQAVSRSHPLPPLRQLRLEILLGERQHEAGQDREARRVLEGSLSRARNLDNPFWLTRCLLALGRSYPHDRAIPCFDQALDACGGAYPARLEAELWRSLSRAYEGKKDHASACTAWERAEGLDPQDPLRLAQMQRCSGQLHKAERTLRDLNDPAAGLQLGLLLVAAGRPEEAVAHLQGARGVEALCALTEAYLKLEKYAEAVTTAEKALAATRTQAEEGDWPARARVLLAEACVADQMWESAARNLLEARGLEPGEELLERIRQAEERLPAPASRVVVESAPAVNPPAVREVKPAAPPPPPSPPLETRTPPRRTREDFEPLPSTLAIDQLMRDGGGGRKLPVKAIAALAVVALLLGGAMVFGKGSPRPGRSPGVAVTGAQETPPPEKKPPEKKPPEKKPPGKKPTAKPTPKPKAAKPTPKPAAAKPTPRPKSGAPTAAGAGAALSVLLAVILGVGLGLAAGLLKGRALAAEGAIPGDVRAESQVAARGTLGLVLLAVLGTGSFLGPPWYKLYPLGLVYTNLMAAIAAYLPTNFAHLAAIFACFMLLGLPLSAVLAAVVKVLVARLPSRLSPD